MEASQTTPHECLERRRLRALHLKQRGWYQRNITEALDVSDQTVSRWLARDLDVDFEV